MRITPPADDNERRLWQLRLERQLRVMDGGRWRVDIIPGRYGWYIRAVPVRNLRKVWVRRAQPRSACR